MQGKVRIPIARHSKKWRASPARRRLWRSPGTEQGRGIDDDIKKTLP
jgi:hypothetical protein